MRTVIPGQHLTSYHPHSIFLAGPTSRKNPSTAWRVEALHLLQSLNFEGDVFSPEPLIPSGNKDEQIQWEFDHLNRATCILFWVPRSLDGDDPLPAFTTNVEFGWWMQSGKTVLGTPPGARNVGYLHWHAKRLGIPTSTTIEDAVQLAIKHIQP